MRVVMAARPAIKVKDSRLWSQNCDGPPKPCSLIIDRAKSKPNRSAFSTIVRLRSKLGRYWGEAFEISRPLLPIGIKTPSCICIELRTDRRGEMALLAKGRAPGQDEMNSFHLRVR